MKKISKLRGMQDTDPIETTKINFVENSFNEISKSYGYQEVRFPIIESTDLFKRSVGDQSDIVNKEMFTFESKSGKSMTLRPEGTAGCMRMAIETGLLDAGQQRLSYKGPMFRYERPQKGRSRQFQQLSLEAYGFNDCAIDLEMLEISNFLFEELSVKEEMTLEINSIGSQKDQQEYSLKLKDYFSKYKKDLDEDSLKRLEKNPLRILDSKNQDLENLIKEAPKIDQSISKESQDKFSLIKNYLEDLEIQYKENPLLVRGLDYYNDLVFEWKTDQLGTQDAICAGGRYDNLSTIIGNKAIPAVGFAIGIDRVVDLLTFQNTDLVVGLSVISNSKSDMSKISSILRNTDNKFTLIQMDAEKSLTKQIKSAVKSNCDILVIVGSEEMSNNILTIKDLRSDRDDRSISFDDFSKFIEEY